MNWLLIIVVLVLTVCMMQGYRKGLLRMLYSLVSWVVMFVLVSWSTPYLNTFLKEQTPVYDNIEAYCEKLIRQKAQQGLENQIQMQTGQISADAMETQVMQQLDALGIRLPESVLNLFSERTLAAAEEIADSAGVYEQLAKCMADFILNGLAFFIALAVAMLLLHFISRFIKAISKIPIIRGVNRYLGAVAGTIYGFMVVWIAFYLIALCSATETGAQLVTAIYQSTFLTYLYENNIIVTILMFFV